MSDAITHLRVLHNNPFIFAPALVGFFKALGEKDRSLLLGYLVLPLVLNPKSNDYLCKARRTSSLYTMLKNEKFIYGLDERVNNYRAITNSTIKCLIDTKTLSIKERLVVVAIGVQFEGGPSPNGLTRAANRLGIFFKPYDVPTSFRMLGVKSL